MASTPSIIAEVSPKHSLPVKHSSMEEDKSTPFPEQAVGGDTSPSHFQKVSSDSPYMNVTLTSSESSSNQE